MIPPETQETGNFAASIGNSSKDPGSDDLKLVKRNEINLRSRKRRRSRRGR